MKKISFITCLVLALTLNLSGQGRGQRGQQAKSGGTKQADNPSTQTSTGQQQPAVSPGQTGGLPPGLARRGGNLPPGLQKYEGSRGGNLPPGLAQRGAVGVSQPASTPVQGTQQLNVPTVGTAAGRGNAQNQTKGAPTASTPPANTSGQSNPQQGNTPGTATQSQSGRGAGRGDGQSAGAPTVSSGAPNTTTNTSGQPDIQQRGARGTRGRGRGSQPQNP